MNIPARAVRMVAIVVVLAALVHQGGAGAAARRETRLFPGQDPAVSPDGKTLAFSRWVDGTCDVWIAPLDGSSPPRRFTDSPSLDRSPAWSPDGRRLCFVSNRSGNKDLWVAPLDDPSAARQLTLNTGPDEDPAWSPDGSLIAYAATVGGVSDLYAVPEAGGEPVRLTRDNHDDAHPTWSPDGRRIAFVSDRQDARNVYMLDVGAMSETARTPANPFVTGAPFHFYQLTGAGRELLYDDSDPAWCPVADVVALSSDRRDEASDERVRTERRVIFLVSIGPRPILSGVSSLRGVFEQPAWTPDGRSLVCSLTPSGGDSEEPMLWLIEGVRNSGRGGKRR